VMTALLDRLFRRLDRTSLEAMVSEERMAEMRWRQRNAEMRAAGCPCGRPATHVQVIGGNLGSVPVEFWHCDEHAGMDGYRLTQIGDEITFSPNFPHSQPCPWHKPRSWKGNANGSTTYYCEHRFHDSPPSTHTSESSPPNVEGGEQTQ
jgi:hypothetical protein